jgi:citrate synthase
MSTHDPAWSSAITEVAPDRIRLRGYPIEELMGRISFSEALHLTLLGELPSAATRTLLDAILVATVDHGATPPSTLAARTVASTGAPANAAMAAGVLAINRHHGGAIEACVLLLRRALERDGAPEDGAVAVVRGHVAEGRRLPGYGHRLHRADPRTARLFELAAELGVAGPGIEMAGRVQRALQVQTGRELPINVDGAIAALLIDLSLPTALANALFTLARTVGLTAHVREELDREAPMRRIDPSDHGYDGPSERSLPTAPTSQGGRGEGDDG